MMELVKQIGEVTRVNARPWESEDGSRSVSISSVATRVACRLSVGRGMPSSGLFVLSESVPDQ